MVPSEAINTLPVAEVYSAHKFKELSLTNDYIIIECEACDQKMISYIHTQKPYNCCHP
jgi:hypothetical protein